MKYYQIAFNYKGESNLEVRPMRQQDLKGQYRNPNINLVAINEITKESYERKEKEMYGR